MIHWLTHKVNGALNKLPKEISRVEINKIGKIEIKGVPVFSLQRYQVYYFLQRYQIYIFCEDNYEKRYRRLTFETTNKWESHYRDYFRLKLCTEKNCT